MRARAVSSPDQAENSARNHVTVAAVVELIIHQPKNPNGNDRCYKGFNLKSSRAFE
jgi:hypothetical protein